MIEPTEEGYVYWVSDEQLATFVSLSPERRLAWVEETRAFLIATMTPEALERMRRLRRGESIDD